MLFASFSLLQRAKLLRDCRRVYSYRRWMHQSFLLQRTGTGLVLASPRTHPCPQHCRQINIRPLQRRVVQAIAAGFGALLNRTSWYSTTLRTFLALTARPPFIEKLAEVLNTFRHREDKSSSQEISCCAGRQMIDPGYNLMPFHRRWRSQSTSLALSMSRPEALPLTQLDPQYTTAR